MRPRLNTVHLSQDLWYPVSSKAKEVYKDGANRCKATGWRPDH